LRFALFKPRFSESRVSGGLAMRALLPGCDESWVTFLTVQLTFTGRWWIGLSPRYRHHTEWNREKQANYQAKENFFHFLYSSMF
jgi:hypothetical protein